MAKVDILRLDSVTANDTTATALINENFEAIQDALENTLSRDGTVPNYMDANLDMNSYKIINLADPVDDLDVVNLRYLKTFVGNLESLVTQATSAANSAIRSATDAGNSAQIAATARETTVAAKNLAEAAAITAQAAASSALASKTAAQAAAESAEESAEYIVNNAPEATVTETETGAIITTKDLTHGEVSVEILNGEEGFSPSASVTKVGTVATITITDKSGTTTAQISDGSGGESYTAGAGIDITDDVISVTDPVLVNTATQSSSLAVGGSVLLNAPYAVAVGKSSISNKIGAISVGYLAQSRSDYGIAIGEQAAVNGGDNAIALGRFSLAAADNAIQIGIGTNTEASSLYIGTDNSHNWKLLDSYGKIPDARLSSNIQTTTNLVTSVSSSSTDSQYPSAKLFYDTCGDIETLINAL